MNAFEENRLKVLSALLMDYHRPDGRLVENADLARDFNLHMTDDVFRAAIASAKHNLLVAESKDGIAAQLKPEGFGEVFGLVADWVDATAIEFSWRKEEILTDARHSDRLPGMPGWKTFVYDRTPASPSAPESATKDGQVGIHIHNTFSPTNTVMTNPTADDNSDRSAAHASWFGAWGTWIAAIVATATLVWILHEAKVF